MNHQLVEMMAAYAAYHGDLRNKLTHFIGVPTVVFSIMIPMAWFRFTPMDQPQLTGATVFFALVMLWYLSIDKFLCLLAAILTLPILYFANHVGQLPFDESLKIFGISFVIGWIFQLLGHAFEGRRPALVDNFAQIFNAPLFLILEVMFMLGQRQELRSAIEVKLNQETDRV